MGLVVALGEAAVAGQPGLHAVELLLADEGRDLGHQDPLLPRRVHPAHGRALARRRRRAPLQRAAAMPAVAIDLAGIGRVGQQAADAGQVPAGQARRCPDRRAAPAGVPASRSCAPPPHTRRTSRARWPPRPPRCGHPRDRAGDLDRPGSRKAARVQGSISPASNLRWRPRRMRSVISVRSYSATAPRICNSNWSCGSWLMGRSRNRTSQPCPCSSSSSRT